jgi:hypothetical protein
MVFSKYIAAIYRLFPMYLSTVSVLIALVGTLAIITMDLSVTSVWTTNTGHLVNGFWSIQKIKAFHLGEIIAITCLWLPVFMSSRRKW